MIWPAHHNVNMHIWENIVVHLKITFHLAQSCIYYLWWWWWWWSMILMSPDIHKVRHTDWLTYSFIKSFYFLFYLWIFERPFFPFIETRVVVALDGTSVTNDSDSFASSLWPHLLDIIFIFLLHLLLFQLIIRSSFLILSFIFLPLKLCFNSSRVCFINRHSREFSTNLNDDDDEEEDDT